MVGKKGKRDLQLHELDRLIVETLKRKPFISNKEISAALGIELSQVIARIKSLDRRDVSRVLAVLDLAVTKQQFCFLRIGVRGRRAHEVAEEIARLPTCLMVSSVADGNYDILSTFRFKERSEISNILFSRLALIRGISNFDIMFIVDVPIFRSEYIIHETPLHTLPIKDNVADLRASLNSDFVDDLDLTILAELQQDIRKSTNAIGKQYAVNPGTIRNRIRAMESRGLLKFVTAVNSTAVGVSTVAFFEISADLGSVAEVVERLRGKEWLPHLFFCSGLCSIVGLVYAENSQHLREIRNLVISDIPGIRSYSIDVIEKYYKNDLRWSSVFTDSVQDA